MDIIFSHDLDATTIKGLNRCRGLLEALFLSDITMADKKYLEHFMFDPGGSAKHSRYTSQGSNPRTGLGQLDYLLAHLHQHRGEAQNAIRQMDIPNTVNMDVVL